MFLETVVKKNPGLVDAAFALHQKGAVLPDSYLVDLDQFLKNAILIRKEADLYGIKLYFMLKQLGRNPYLAKKLIELGYDGAVVVDFKEAQRMMEHKIPIGNVGHLVQLPDHLVSKLVEYGVEVITVYSMDKVKQIHEAAKKYRKIQSILIRVNGREDKQYSGQTAGFMIEELQDIVEEIKMYLHVKIVGVTSFPCYLFQEEKQEIEKTENLNTVLQASQILRNMGITPEIINTPSSTCVKTLRLMKRDGGTCGEPGHGLTGTTPEHAVRDLEELPSVIYLSEISHNYDKKAYCYGGGHYRRSHLKNALVGNSREDGKIVEIMPPTDESIDYHFGLDGEASVGESVIMAFRFQIFVTRSDVVLVKGVSSGQPEIIGVYDSLGNVKWEKNS